ncbi:MAG TPA: ABC transporter permease [Candidatus Acidoferrales bacterium]|nr:ABC transporter permease [Candidatus Acidoferrales bacterium]
MSGRATFVKRGASLREPVGVALETLRAHKLRSFLMLLGIILSVSTLIVVVALIEGANRYIAGRVANLGSNVFLVTRFGIITEFEEFIKATRRNKNITWEDYEAFREALKLPKNIGVETREICRIRGGNHTLEDVSLRGVTASIGDMDVEEPASGRYISESDDTHRTAVTLIGSEVANRMFPNVDPIGHNLEIDGRPFEVIGVAKPIGTVLGQSQDKFVYIPVETLLKIYGANRNLTINIQARGPEWMMRTQDEARVLMRARHHLRPEETDNFAIFAADSIIGLFHQLTSAIAAAMVGVVSVFLVIGGVVIMNVMLSSVTERTREIGLRKSLGARRSDILMQFLVESGVMAGLGGAIGVLFAYLITLVVGATTSVPMAVPFSAVLIALSVSTAVGLFFGLYPAHKASRLDPIVALRMEV